MLGPQLMISSWRPAEEQIDPPAHDPAATKPDGGMWTSTETSPGSSEWTDAVGYGADAWRLEPSTGLRVYKLDSEHAADRLVERFGAPAPSDPVEARLRASGLGLVDWAAVAREYDGVHYVPWRRVGEQAHPVVDGWDIESTWHARWNFDDVEMATPDWDSQPETSAPKLTSMDQPARRASAPETDGPSRSIS